MGCGSSAVARTPEDDGIPSHLKYHVSVPHGIMPGDFFPESMFDGSDIIVPVLVPENAKPGEEIVATPGCSGRIHMEDGQTVNAHGVKVCGNRCVVNGHFNLIEGDHCTINGSFNWVRGVRNIVTGIRNAVHGDGNHVSGDQNIVDGDDNSVCGAHNKVEGDDNNVTNSATHGAMQRTPTTPVIPPEMLTRDGTLKIAWVHQMKGIRVPNR
mmetsp:Transcript_32788/g.54182  ORF Transcript_32788/g.54182 Transcript_32788/m.54182 type:complete len:211 (+) Transcript_32788:27-659(+)